MQQLSPKQVFERLFQEFGEQNWWPVSEKGAKKPAYKKRKKLTEKQKLEICLGAILAQNTSWKNAEKAIINLNNKKMIGVEKIANARQTKLAMVIRSSGYFNQKARKLKFFCRHVRKNYGGKIDSLLEKPVVELRRELLSMHGVGEETADSIILYAAQKPSFVADLYTRRFTERYFGKTKQDYAGVKDFFEKKLPKDTQTFSEMHALLVEFAKQHCRKKPLCEKCFLNGGCSFFHQKMNSKANSFIV